MDIDAIRVLHVDDEPDLPALVADSLVREDERFRVETATNAKEGLDRLAAERYDCVVSDYDMPGETGIEFLRSIREDHPDLPFILYTGKGSEEVASEAISAGVTDYLQKESGTDQYKILANRIMNSVERSHAEQERKQMRERMEIALEYTDSIIFEIDFDADEVIRHGAFQKFFDVSANDVPTWEDHLEKSVHRADQDKYRRFFEQIADGDRDGGTIEYRTNPEVGSSRWIENTVSVKTAPNGNGRQAIGIARDITEYKDRQEELQEKKRRYQAVFNDPNILVGLIDTDGTVLDINKTALEYIDASIEDVTDTLFWKTPWFNHSDTVRTEVKDWVDRAASGEYVEFEVDLVRPDGSPYTIAGVFRPVLTDGGDVVSVLISDRDITEQKKREQERKRQNERLEEFASVISHDLRTPMYSASGRLALAREECDSEHLDAIGRAHERMEGLIEDLLQFAREGDAAIAEVPVDLREITKKCWIDRETTDAVLSADTDQVIQADRSRVQQLLENLLRNAVEHGGEDVTVTIDALEDGFYIEDDGNGVPPEKRDTVFEAGYSTSNRGTGFGLPIVKQVVDAHDWDICVTEGTTGGARFEITGVDFAD